MVVHCRCDNDNHARCGEVLFERKLNANFYDESDGQIWYVPGFCAFDHQCGTAGDARIGGGNAGAWGSQLFVH